MRDLFGDDTPTYANAKFPELRPFQKSTHEALRAGIRAGHKNQLVMAPTGGGKTLLAMNVIHEALKKGRRAMFVADRRTLINQTSQVADSLGLSAHGVLMADHWRYRPDMPFQIASAQTLARREWPDVDVLIVDECHVQLAVWAEHIPTCRAAVVGLSATPFSPGLGKLFSNLINATTMHDLTESGVLVPLRVLTCKRADMTGAATAGGEWTDLAAQERGMEIVGNVVEEWTKHGESRKTICFGSTIQHCEAICRQFNEVGVMASLFTSETSEAERAQILAEFKKVDSSIRVLVSVEALAKGFDQKDVSCVIDCRPLRKSISTFIQMVGRGLRASPDTGKTDCILLDHSGNIIRFADDFSKIFYEGLDELDAGEKLDKEVRRDNEEDKEPKACPACGFKPMGRRCIACGHEPKSLALIEHLPGHMQEVVINNKRLANDHLHLYEQIATYMRSHGNPETARGRTAHLFRELIGDWPRYRFESAPNVEITRNVLNQIRSRAIRFAKGKSKEPA